MLETGHHYRDQVSKIISWGHWFSLANILLAILLASRYIFIAEWPETMLGQVYSLISLLGHFSFIIFILYLVVIFPISFVIPFPRALRFLTVIFATVGLSLLIIDTEIFKLYNLHINPIIFEILLGENEQTLNSDWQSFFVFVPFLFLLELLISSLLWHRLRPLSRFKLGPIIAIFFFCCFLTGHLLHMWADAAVYRPITAQKANFPLAYPMTARTFLVKYGWLDKEAFSKRIRDTKKPSDSRLDYPKHPLVVNDENQKLNVLLINISTLRADMLNDSVMPEMSKLSRQGLRFNHHFSTSNDDLLGNFGMMYGLAPQYWDDIETSATSPFMLDYFVQADYNLGIFNTEALAAHRQEQTTFINLESPNTTIVAGTQQDSETVSATRRWIKQQDETTAWFAYVSLQSVQKVETPAGFPAMFYPNIQDLNSQASNRQIALFNSYRNSVSYIDKAVAKIIYELKQTKQYDNTVIVFTANHGNEFNDSENHSWGYGSNYSTYQTQVPLFIVWPGKTPQVIEQDTNHTDIVPTILANLNAVNNPISDYSNGIDLFSGEFKTWQLLGDKNNFVILQQDTITLFSYQGLFSRQGNHDVRNRLDYKSIPREEMLDTQFNQILTELNYFYKATPAQSQN
ncbi:MAG: membrane-anchored protein YejM (alkaline phosphatase superfamily) [Moritella dasanensis]|jgi:membrane-anchored protein YejM (alkaline phosphatase superfamily)